MTARLAAALLVQLLHNTALSRSMKKILTLFLVLYSLTVYGTEYKMQSINVYLPYGWSTSPERIFRILEQYGKKKNINFVPIVKPGGDGTVGVSGFLDEPANGNSILLTVVSDISRPNPIKKFKESDLYPVSYLANTAVFVVANRNVPVNNLQELQEYLKKEPDRFTWGVVSKAYEEHITKFTQLSGGDSSRLIVTKFNTGRGLTATTAVMGGHIDLSMTAARALNESAQRDQVKILGVVRALPGYEQYQSFKDLLGSKWQSNDGIGIFVNAKSSSATKAYWDKFVQEFKNDPEVQRMLLDQYFIPDNDPNKKELHKILELHRDRGTVKIKMSELTGRQAQVAELISQRGLSNKQIARELGIGESAVKVHVGSMLKKYGLRDRTQLSVYFNKESILG